MADNLLIPISGGTATAATEDVGGAHYQKMMLANEAHASFRGRCGAFRTPGRAGTAPRRLIALHNVAASGIIVHLNQITVDLYQTVVKAVTVAPPILRVQRFSGVPTGGTALAKIAKDSSLSSSASVVITGDASADGALSTTALSATSTGVLTQEFAPRLITAAGYEMYDRTELLEGKDIVVRAGEGVMLTVDYTAAGQEPATDMWIATIDWYEHT